MNAFLAMCLAAFCLYWIWSTITFTLKLRHVVSMYHFYTHTLNIPDRDMQSIEWNEVVRLLLLVQPTQVSRRLDEFELASRILRKDNYLTGMINHNVLNLKLGWDRFSTSQLITQYMEWCLRLTLISRLFDDDKQVDLQFLSYDKRDALAASLRRRFLVMGIFGLLFSPFMVFILLATFLFRYGEEIHRDPRSLSARRFSPYARFQFREFNEYPHQFDRRIATAVEKSDEYVGLFPSEKLSALARLVAFVSGAFAVMLAFVTIIDEEAILRLEITPGRTVLWYLGIFSAVFALARALIPEESRSLFRPNELMREIAEHTHYMPTHWLRRLHSDAVRQEFASLFQYRLVIFAAEVFGIVTVPLILIFSLRPCAADIIDFIRDASVETERVGAVCCFATSQISVYGDARYAARRSPDDLQQRDPAAPPRRVLVSRNGKMERSLLTFIENNPRWTPPDELQQYVELLREQHARFTAVKQDELRKSVGSTEASAHSVTRSGASDQLQQMNESVMRQSGAPSTILGVMELLDRVRAQACAYGLTDA